MFKRPHYIALGIVGLLALAIWSMPGRTAAQLKLGISSLFVPLFGLANSAGRVADQAGDALLPRRELLRQLGQLRRENQELKLQLQAEEEALRENARLRQLFDWQRRQPRKHKLANVVLRDPANWWRTVEIDLGTRHGVSNNLPVLSPDGYLVGRISSAGLTRSHVVLLGDPNCNVSARVENETRDTGIIGPSGPLDDGFVELGYLSRNASLKTGQEVRTSGLGGVFPKDIPIGTVVDTHSAEFGLEAVARVKLGANLSALEAVWVRFLP